jgi:hypothetical protein
MAALGATRNAFAMPPLNFFIKAENAFVLIVVQRFLHHPSLSIECAEVSTTVIPLSDHQTGYDRLGVRLSLLLDQLVSSLESLGFSPLSIVYTDIRWTA